MRRRWQRTRTLVLIGALALTATAPRQARSQSVEDKAAAEALFDEGKKLLGEKRFVEACARFESSQRLDPGVGTLLFLADCYETVGRTASAWSTFREAAAAAKSAGQAEREQIARERAGKLNDKLFQLTLNVAISSPGLKVTRNDKEVKQEVWGAALPVDPGVYKVTATAPGKKTWSTTVEIPQDAGARSIDVPALEDAPPEPAVTTSAAASTASSGPPPGMSNGRIGGMVVGLAGLAVVGVGAAFGGVAASQYSSANTRCPNTKCGDQGGVDLAKQAGATADVATALFVAGGAIVAGGVIVFVLSPSKGKAGAPQAAWISPMVGGHAAGAAFGRTW